jgi:hypothetical protein
MLKNVSLFRALCPKTKFEVSMHVESLQNCMICPDSIAMLDKRGQRAWVCNYGSIKTGKRYRKDGTDK